MMLCTNILFVSGSVDALAKFRMRAEGVDCLDATKYHEFNLNNFVPFPKELTEEKAIRQWQTNNWGCREGVLKSGCTERYDMGAIDYNFLTHTTPPEKALLKISEQFQDLSFELIYKVPSRGLKGEVIFQGGQVRSKK